jgi:hypothetical protein
MAKLNWDVVRDSYIVGDETYAQVAARIGLTPKAVEKHAIARRENGGCTWGELREKHRAKVSEAALAADVDEAAGALSKVRTRHAETLAWLAGLSRANIEAALGRCSAKDKVRFGLAIIALERRVHGLDKMKVELTGEDGKPIEHDIELDDDTRALAESFLEAVFGKGARPG